MKDKGLEGLALTLLVSEGFTLPRVSGESLIQHRSDHCGLAHTAHPVAKSTRPLLLRKPSDPSLCASP